MWWRSQVQSWSGTWGPFANWGHLHPVGVRWAPPPKSATGSDCPFKALASAVSHAARPVGVPHPPPSSPRRQRAPPRAERPSGCGAGSGPSAPLRIPSSEPGVFEPLSMLFLHFEKCSSEHLCGATFSLWHWGLEEILRLIYRPCVFLLGSRT